MLNTSLSRLPSIADLRELARRRVPRFAFDYIDGGAEAEVGLRANVEAFSRLTLTPQYFVDVAKRSTEVTLFGRTYAQPWGIAPVGLAGLMWPGVDATLALEAGRRQVPYVLSTPASLTIEKAAEIAPEYVWFQLYVLNDTSITKDLLRRAHAVGIEVVVVTVDLPLPAKRERDIRNQLTLPLRPSFRLALDVMTHPLWAMAILRHGAPQFANLAPYAPKGNKGTQSLAAFMAAQLSPRITWDVIDQLRADWPGRLLVKGILSPRDAKAAVDRGVDGLIVSNHGGRQFDGAPASIDALPAIAKAVEGRVPLIFDGGIRRGLDIIKAVAHGANFTLMGRAPLYGAGAGGAEGVTRALDILQGEVSTALGQLGCARVADLNSLEQGYRRP